MEAGPAEVEEQAHVEEASAAEATPEPAPPAADEPEPGEQ